MIIAAARLWDGTDREPVQNGAVAVSGTRVTAVGPRAAIANQETSETPVLNFPGATILPGLIDTHVHLIWPGDGTPADRFTVPATDARLLLQAVHNARVAIESGVTTVRDVGSRGRIVLDVRQAVDEGLIDGPRILASGPPITIRGGHMYYLGGEADTAEEARTVARTHWRMGADFFKVVANGGGTPRTHPWIPTYTKEQIAAVVAEAREHETHVTVHANAVEAIRRCVEAGVHGIEHCTFLDGPGRVAFNEALAQEMARKAIYVGHTLQAAYRMLERIQERWQTLGPEERAFWDGRRRVWDAQMANAARLLEIGVPLVASTDAGWSLNPFGDYPLAMELLVQAGATPHQALVSGASVAAMALGIADQVGTLEPGKRADLVVIDGDPTRAISDLRRVRAVIRDGRVIVLRGSDREQGSRVIPDRRHSQVPSRD